MYQFEATKAKRKFNGDTDRQSDRVLKRLLIEKPDREGVMYGRVSSLHLSRDTGALQYCRCLNDLAKDGWVIKSEVEYPDGKKIGYFRLIGWTPVAPHVTPSDHRTVAEMRMPPIASGSLFSAPMRSWTGDQ